MALLEVAPDTGEEPDLTAAIESASDIHEVAAACRQVAGCLGFEHFICEFRAPHTLTHPCRVILSGYPRAWRERYDRKGYLAIDPIGPRAVDTVLPFGWDELDRGEPAVARLFQEAAVFGLRHGLSVPLHGAHGEVGALSLARADRPLPATAGERQRLFQMVQWWSASLHQKLRRLLFEERAVTPRLTRRERDCLSLAAKGQSAQSIGKTLSITERTAVFHLSHAKEKLGARCRQHAVARGVALGLIEPACHAERLSDFVRLVELNETSAGGPRGATR